MRLILLFLFCSASFTGCTQNTSKKSTNTSNAADLKVGASCEGCEAIFECPVPFPQLNNTDTLPGFTLSGPAILVTGTIYQRDGHTPARDIVLYIYHTDLQGRYATAGATKTWEKRHGTIRGWIRTGADGTYKFYSLLPASYPNSQNPRHIHPIIKEPGKTEYWIDEFVFDNDPLLPAAEKNRNKPVGGSGLIHIADQNGLMVCRRDIILGLNVSNYPN